jgi:predicted MPP superfamily phosphohydrolase
MSQPSPYSLEESQLHKILVSTNRLQELPTTGLALLMIFDATIVGWVWLHLSLFAGIAAGTLMLVASLTNWALLWLLPRTGRSFGPDKPSALALTLILALVLALIGYFASAPTALIVAALVAVALTLIVYYATWIEPFRLGLTQQTLTKGNATPNDVPLRLLHVGDLHLERETSRERKLNTLIEQVKPDIIVFSGDFVNLSYTWDAQAKADIRKVIGAWHAPLGVYCVPGTPIVEPLSRVLEFVQGLDNLTLLPNRWATIETPMGAFHIAGHITTHDLPTDRQSLAELAQISPGDGFKTLLTHAPDIAPEAAAAGFDLYLCGHTHGGQIRLPLIGAVFSSSHLGNRFIMGRYPVGKMTLYTTRGVGMEGYGAPRARFLCPPEIVLWEIRF